jgi:hypothetical protein
LVLCGLGGILAGKHLAALTGTLHWRPGQAAVRLLVLLPTAWLLAVLLHELGHALAGRSQGFRFHWLVVGPFRWEKQAGRLRFQWNTNLGAAGGMVLCVPTDGHNLRRRFMTFAAGGPLASLLWAAVALGSYALLPASGKVHLLGGGLFMGGVMSAAIAFMTLIPTHMGGFYSDGARVLNMWRGGVASQFEIAVLAAVAHSVAGTRPRDLPLAQLEAAAALPQELPFKLYIYHYLYLSALDAGHTGQAGRYLGEYRDRLASLPVTLQAGGWLESAFFAAAYAHDLPAAQAFRAQAKLSSYTPADVLPRVEAALARLAGDAEQARTQALVALRELPKSLDQGSAHLYAEWLTDTVRWADTTDK